MTEHHESEAGRAIARDLEALRVVTARDVPTIQDTARALSGHAPELTREDWLMKTIRVLKARPLITTAAATVAIAAALLVIPISYERTVGHDLSLTIAGEVDRDAVQKIVSEYKTALEADGVRVSMVRDEDGTRTQFHASSASRSSDQLQAKATAFAQALSTRGYNATAQVEPRREQVSTNMYAYAMDRVVEIRIDREGRTPAEIEADIRSQLEAAGLQNATVSVTQEGDQTQVSIHADHQEGDEEHRFDVRVQGSGTEPMDAQIHKFEVVRRPGMTDADCQAEIERQMREAGVEGTVTVENGEVKVEIHREHR